MMCCRLFTTPASDGTDVQEYFKPEQIYHVVVHDRVVHVVCLRDEVGFVAWCLEFPSLTVTAPDRQSAIRMITETIAQTANADDHDD